jgi:DNA invertase Pin-like site-specific DNA recombinase
MRALGFYRSEESLFDGSLVNSQVQEYCERYFHQPVRSFIHVGPHDEAPDVVFGELTDYMRQNHSNYLIVVPDASHLGTDLESVARALIHLESSGSKVVCDDDDIPDPIQNAFETLGIKGISRTRSERIKESMLERAMKGQGLGKPPYGYRNCTDGGLQIVLEESPIVELIYRLYTKEGLGLRLIAQHLNEREIPTRRGGKWNMVTIRDILRNPTYMGTYTRFGLRLPKSHEPIIPPKTFRLAQDETRARRPSSRVVNPEPFLLSSLVYCGSCSNKMMGVTRRQTWKRKDGRRARGVYRYYQCQSRNNLSTCEYHTWRAGLLENTVLSQLRYELAAKASPVHLNGHGDQRVEEARRIWETRVKNAERRFLHAMRKTAKGMLSVESLGEYIGELDRMREGARNAEQPSDAASVFTNWESLTFDEKQSFLLTHVAKIVVQDETIEVLV